MTNILYGVSGEGFGHASRSKEILTHLAKDHNIQVITYGKAYSSLKQHFPTTEIYGLHFAFHNNKIDHLNTVKKNIQHLLTSSAKFKQLRMLLKTFKPDIIITDFEPTSFYLSQWLRVPLLSIDNQHRITNLALDVPRQYRKDYALCKLIIRLLIPRADTYFVTSFFHEKIIRKHTFLFAPILRNELLQLKPTLGNHVLVYQTSTSNTRLLDLLRTIPEQFIIYGFNKNKREGNLRFKKTSSAGFLRDLASCKAVITNGGFTLMTEALHLHKPILSEPVQGQFEQLLNAYYLQKLGYGMYRDVLRRQDILLFLDTLATYRQRLKKYPRSDLQPLLRQLQKFIRTHTA